MHVSWPNLSCAVREAESFPASLLDAVCLMLAMTLPPLIASLDVAAAIASKLAIVLPKLSVHKWPDVPTIRCATKDSDRARDPVNNKSPPSLCRTLVLVTSATLG